MLPITTDAHKLTTVTYPVARVPSDFYATKLYLYLKGIYATTADLYDYIPINFLEPSTLAQRLTTVRSS